MFLLAAVILSTGAVDPNCTQDKVCQSGYTQTVRPPAAYTNHLKLKQMKTRGLSERPQDYEEDHFIPLELCGCPRCPENLWPQPWTEAHKKDLDENRLHKQVCNGFMTLKEGQNWIRTHWKIHE